MLFEFLSNICYKYILNSCSNFFKVRHWCSTTHNIMRPVLFYHIFCCSRNFCYNNKKLLSQQKRLLANRKFDVSTTKNLSHQQNYYVTHFLVVITNFLRLRTFLLWQKKIIITPKYSSNFNNYCLPNKLSLRYFWKSI